jgi:hypothetical protein
MDITGGIGPIAFYLITALLVGLAVYFFRNTQPYSITGDSYEKKSRRRLIAKVLLVVAAISLMVAVVEQLVAMQ